MNRRTNYSVGSTQYFLIFLQTALQYLFDNAVIAIDSYPNIINLMEYLPMVKQGYILDSALIDLLSIIVHMSINDHIILEAFGSNIPAFLYLYKYEGLETKVTMQHALAQGMISNYLNTFQVMSARDLTFDPNNFISYNHGIRWLSYLNKQNASDLPELNIYLQNEEFRQILIHEHAMIKEMHRIVESVRGDMPQLDNITAIVIMEHITDLGITSLPRLLIADDHVNINRVIYAIILDDPDLLEQYINNYDPRDNNFEAYNLAIERGNLIIIERIKRAIVERNLLEQQTFQNMMVPLGESDVPQTEMFRHYGRSLINK